MNIAEMLEDTFLDQPCKHGHRAGTHAVYCHNEEWPGAPRKCRKSWYTGDEIKDEDCKGFLKNNILEVE